MSIQVTAFLNPFSKKKNEFHFDEAISIQEIIKKIDSLHAVNTGWRVLIDDEIITDFTRIPKDGQHVFLKIVPESDNESTGIGMKVGGALAVVGGIAAIAFLGWTGIGGLAGVALIGAGVGCFTGGAVLYNIDIPSVTTNKKKQETPDQDPSIRGSENQMRPYGVIPTLFGRRRIYADLAATSFTWADNGSVYLYQLFCAGQKDMTIDTDTIKIDETLLKDYSASKDINTILAGNDQLIDMRIHQDGSMPLLYDKCVHEEQVNAILKHETEEGLDGSVIRTLPAGAKEINIDIFFYNGLGKYGDDGNLGETSVEVTSWYKESDEDDSAYQTLGYFTLTQAKYHRQNLKVLLKRYVWVCHDTIWDSFSSWIRIDGDNFTINPDNKSLYTVVIRRTTQSHYDHSIKIVEFSVAYTDAIVGTNTITASELKTKRYSITKTGLDESKSYTVKISRTSADSTDTKVIDDVYVGSIRAAKNMLPVQAERAAQLTLIELKIKASEKLNNVIKELNFVAESKLPSYSGSGSGVEQWTYANSRNPASAIMYAMQGDFAQQKLTNDDIEWPMFENLYTWCQNHGYECNAYLTEQMSISVLLSSIASTCRAEVLRMNGKLTVIQDIERESFTQLFTPRNSHDYSESIALSEIPDAQNLNFVDESSGYAENSARVYNTPNGNYAGAPETTQEVQLWGVTNSDQALKLGMYNYAVSNHRFLLHKFSCDFEYLMCQKGDWIKYAGDIALAGITQGRIASVLLNDQDQLIGFECDEEIPMESGKSYGMRVRKQNGVCIIFYLANEGTSSKTVALLNPEAVSDTTPDEGDLFTFGEVKGAKLEDAIDLIVTDIQCGENLSADLTCVEYSPEIFGVDEEGFELPAYESKISEVSGTIDAGVVTETWETYFTYHGGDTSPEPATGDGTNAGWHLLRTDESYWVSSKTAPNIYDGAWGAPLYIGPPIYQYSDDGETQWHDTFTAGDLYMRQSTDGRATWSDPIRIVGPTGATGAKGDDGEDGLTIQILSSTGTVFKNGTGSTILTAHIYQGGIELDSDGNAFSYQWKKYDAAGNLVPSFTATTKSITVTADDVANKNDYEVEVTW